MATKQSSSSKIMVPQARAAMNKFKMEAANEVGVDLKKGYNGSMTTREALQHFEIKYNIKSLPTVFFAADKLFFAQISSWY